MAYPHKSRKIAQTIERWFKEKKFRPGDRFPSDQALAEQFGVNHITVRAALKRFVEAGLLERRVGAGTVVRAPPRPVEPVEPAPLAGGVGVAVPDGSHGFYSEILRAIEGTLLGTGRPLLLGYTWEIAGREQQVVEGWMARNVRHLILAATVPDPAFYASLIGRGVHLVLLDRRVPGLDVASVTTEDDEAVGAIVRLLVGQGHRRVVHLAGPTTIWTAQVRRKLFLEAAAAAGLAVDDRSVVPAGYFMDDGYRAALSLLAAPPLPDAIFAANDPAAVGAIRAFQEHGVKVPGDVSVIGYGDDLDLSRSFGLTTVRQFPDQMGLSAVRLALAATPSTAADSVTIRPELVVRSSAAPRAQRPAARPAVAAP